MRFRLIVALLTIALLGVVGTPNADGQTVSDRLVTDAAVDIATDVINGTVIAVQSVDTGVEVHSVALVSVNEAVEGSLSGEVFVSVPGGTMNDGRQVTVSHMPHFRVGDNLQLALLRAPAAREAAMTGGLPLYAVVGGTEGAAAITGSLLSQSEAVTDFALTGARWNPNDGNTWPIDYRINTSGSGLSNSVARTELLDAAAEWVADPGSDIEIVSNPGSTTASPDNFYDNVNTVGWTAAAPGDTYLAQAIWVTSGGFIQSFDIRFNTAYTWANVGSGGSGFDVETVQLHEFGHVLGLDHITGTAEARAQVMYPSVSSNTIKPLGDGDRGGAANLYPAANPPAPDPTICDGLVATIDMNTNGGNGTGTAGDDVILGTPGNDVINGLGGNDRICSGEGADTVTGGTGADRIFGGPGADALHGNDGDDHIEGGTGGDLVWGYDGNDTVHGGDGDDLLQGNAGDDTIHGDAGSDSIHGQAGTDDLNGGDGPDYIWGYGGNDLLMGNAGADVLQGMAGIDRLEGHGGIDTLIGGADGDLMYGGNDGDVLWGLDGNDWLDGGNGNDVLLAGDGIDTAVGGPGVDNILGDAGNDTLYGGEGLDLLWGGTGVDLLMGGNGNDILQGGDDDDRLEGEAGNDTMIGDAGADYLIGGSGNDVLWGFGQNDTLAGGPGSDTLLGGGGTDSCTGGPDFDIPVACEAFTQ
ncbi:MAG: matrixin family metalloprotease [Actinomycetota bacterium]